MKVAELIAQLQKLDPTWDVRVQDGEFHTWDSLETIEEFPGGIQKGPWQEEAGPFVGLSAFEKGVQ